ncbi:condensation domain-containing protein [Dactylosporangium sp. CA-139114]|uniref:condensation domain-containing protein n=1 Tax=Dactylosporangium sp. CA-139114 TaxID=3239931 RepID=UPI003D9709E9
MPDDPLSAALTWGQRAILGTIDDLGPKANYFTIRRVLPLPTGDEDRIRRMLRDLAREHESLRTIVVRSGGTRTQRVLDEGPVPAAAEELAHGEDAVRRARVTAANLAETPFDLTVEPPIRYSIVRAHDGDAVLALAVSHFAADAYALSLLTRRIGRLGGGDDGAERPSVQTVDWQPRMQAAAEAARSAERRTERAVERWTKVLAAAAAPQTLDARPGERADRFVEWSLESADVQDATERSAQRTQTSPASVVLAVWCLTIAMLDGRDDVALTLISGNRHRDRERGYVGPLAQDTPMLARLSRGQFDDFVRNVHREALNAYADGRYDPAALANALGAVDDSVRPPSKVLTFFNDARGAHPASTAGRPPAGPALRRIGQWAQLDLQRFLVLQQIGPSCRLRLLVDTDLVAAERIPIVLAAMADALTAAADGTTVERLTRMLEVACGSREVPQDRRTM